MALIEVKKLCNECEKTRAKLRDLERTVEDIRLDYHGLYEKVRHNLAKLAARDKAEAKEDGD